MNYQFCPKCNFQNAPGMSFCSNCGASLPNVSNFSPEPAPTVFSPAQSFTPPTPAAPNFSAPPKNSNVGKILLAVAGVTLLLLIGVGVVGAAVFYFATKREVYPQNVSQRPLYDNNSNVAPISKTRTIDDFVRSQ